ncbi:GspE/PulE family protein [Aliiroseovarius halocynthiae]|uniref:GspE/PulE family protein n=1 Tax=Aliiroseovarius halocynthiae TaxID=985055 RepID=UPI00163D3DC0|nr:GspE/PulE family protein [Aliiroseovarius halocynthiae]
MSHLQSAGDLDDFSARRALEACEEAGTTIERTLLEIGLASEDTVFRALADYLSLPFTEAADLDPAFAQTLDLPIDFLERVAVLPVKYQDDHIVIATADPRATDVFQSISYHLKSDIAPVIASPSTIKGALAQIATVDDNDIGASSGDIDRLRALANEGPVIKLVNDILAEAVSDGASDVHIEAQEAGARVRYRVDGVLDTRSTLRDDLRAAVVSRLKVMANLNISEKRRPQDGRADISVRGRMIDIRMSTLPTMYGESIVMRLLDRANVALDWQALGYSTERTRQIVELINAPNGIFLVAGPTGSGKTTTLYTALQEINTSDRKIVTVEDPVEYALQGVNQVQVNPEIDLSFASALRAILRQDPNVVMVGEIRDEETAEIAVRAALVGRLVLSTVHTNSSISAIDRLRDLGVPPYLIAATVRGVLSQRLVRKTCTICAGAGCDTCSGSGAKGRTAISELLSITPRLTQMISDDCSDIELSQAAAEEGFVDMMSDAELGMHAGLYSTEEILRVLGKVPVAN